MPTKNPRLTITFKPSFAVRLRRLSELTGNSQGALAAEFLEGAVPAIDRLIRLIEAAQGAKADVVQKLQTDLAQAQGRVEAQLGISLDEIETVTLSLLDQAEAIPRRGVRASTRKRADSVGASPVAPSSNRGVRSTTKTHRTAP